MPGKLTSNVLSLWLMVVTLLLASWFTIPRLNYDVFSGDELNSIYVSGMPYYGDLAFPIEIIERTHSNSPDQALGFPLVAHLWGNFAGWNELSLRALSLLVGVLVITITYRVGHDMFSPFVGISAALTLASSIYFITYMHKFRTFMLVALSAVIVIWCYWRIALSGKRTSWLADAGLIIGGIGLIYTHYFATPFIFAVGLYHLLLAPKNRRWFRPVILFVPVLVSGLITISFALTGLEMNQTDRPDLLEEAMSPLQITERFAWYFGNGSYLFPIAFGVLLTVCMYLLWRQQPTRSYLFYLCFITLFYLVGIIALNEIAGVMPPQRIRYLMGLWIPAALLVGVCLWSLKHIHRSLPYVLLAVWSIWGSIVTIQDSLMISDGGDNRYLPDWRTMIETVQEYGEPQDRFISVGHEIFQLSHYTYNLENTILFKVSSNKAEFASSIEDQERVWLNVSNEYPPSRAIQRFDSTLIEYGFVLCDTYYEDDDLWLRLFAITPIFCGSDNILLSYGDAIQLKELAINVYPDNIVVDTGWGLTPEVAVKNHEALFVFLDTDGNFVTSESVSMGKADGPYLPMRATFDRNRLDEGTFTFHVTIRNTTGRLPVYDPNGNELDTRLPAITELQISG